MEEYTPNIKQPPVHPAQAQTADGRAVTDVAARPYVSLSSAAEGTADVPLNDLRISLTREEILFCVRAGSGRTASRGRLWAQTAILALLAVYCVAAFFISGMEVYATLFIGLAAVALGVVMWVVPEARNRRIASREAEQNKTLHVRVYEDAFGFGDGESFERLAFEDCRAQRYEEMLLLRFQGGFLVGIPRRLLSEDDWERMCARLKPEDRRKNGKGRVV